MYYLLVPGFLLFAEIVFLLIIRDVVRRNHETNAYRILWLPMIGIMSAVFFKSMLIAPDYWMGLMAALMMLGGFLVTLPSAAALVAMFYWYPYRKGRASNAWFRVISLALAVTISFYAYRVGRRMLEKIDIASHGSAVPVSVERVLPRA